MTFDKVRAIAKEQGAEYRSDDWSHYMVIRDSNDDWVRHGVYTSYDEPKWKGEGNVSGRKCYYYDTLDGPYSGPFLEVDTESYPASWADSAKTFKVSSHGKGMFRLGKEEGEWSVKTSFKNPFKDQSQTYSFERTLNYLNGKLHGKCTWRHTATNTLLSEMTFHLGVLDGTLIEWGFDGVVTRKEKYQMGKLVQKIY